MENLQQHTRDPRDLKPHPDNPRGVIDPESPEVIELCGNIMAHGIIQPIVINSRDVIQAGHRRTIAAIRAGLTEVPVVYRDLTGGEFIEEIFLAENAQRQDLSPLEEARLIAGVKQKLEKRTKRAVTNKELTRRLNIPPATISQRLAILKLPERIQNLFHICELPVRSATQLVRLEEWPDEIEKFADRMVTRQITYASLDALITRRMHVLQAEGDERKRREREARLNGETPANNGNKRHSYRGDDGASTALLTREVVTANLSKKLSESISMFNVKAVLDSVCCNCGMVGNREVCLSCPLPKFVNGLVGRATGGGTSSNDEDED